MIEHYVHGQLKQVVMSVEENFYRKANSAAEKGVKYAGISCTNAILSNLRADVAATPYVRSINLVKENQFTAPQFLEADASVSMNGII